MSLKFVDIPVPLAESDYADLIDRIVKQCDKHPEIQSVYQLGSVKHPGISDLDLLCVVASEATSELNFRVGLSPKENQVLTHNVFVADEKDLPQTLNFGFFTTPKHIFGKQQESLLTDPTTDFDEGLGRQIALEYMLKMHVSLSVQMALGVIKLRAFLLEAKAIAFDLQLLGIEENDLLALVEEVLHMRQTWFEYDQTSNLEKLLTSFSKELEQTLRDQLNRKPLLASGNSIKIARNLTLTNGSELKLKFSGVKLPTQLSFLGKRFINLQSRFGQFDFFAPLEQPTVGSLAQQRFQFYGQLVDDYQVRFPHFSPLTSVLPLYR